MPGANFSGLSAQTLFTEIVITDGNTNSGYICGRIESAWDYGLQIYGGSAQISFGTGGYSGATTVSFPSTSAMNGLAAYQNRPLPVCGTYDKVNAKIYVDGKLGNSVAYTGSFPSSSDRFAIGGRGGGNQPSLNGVYVGIVLLFKRVLSDVEIASLSANPWQVFIDPRADDDLVATASTPDTSFIGSAVAAAAASGALTTSIRSTGSAAAQASAAGALSTSISLVGAAAAQAFATGALSTSIRLASTVAAQVTTAGGLSSSIRLVGAAAASALASGSFAGAAAVLSSAVVVASTASGALSTAIPLAGSAGGWAASAGTLTTRIPLGGVVSTAASGTGTLADGGATPPPSGVGIDVAQISLERIAVFDGTGSRLAVFEGTGSRVAVFESSGSRVRFDQMSAKVPTMVSGKMTTNRDPDEESYYATDITDELADRNTTPLDGAGAVDLILNGVSLLEGPSVQIVTVDGLPRTYVVVLLGGTNSDPPEVWNWVARVRCKNGERFDKTTWFNRVDT